MNEQALIDAPPRAYERLPLWVLIAALAVLYFLAGKIGLSFAALHKSASAVWPPTGIALGAFLIFGTRVWPAVFAGAFFVNVTTEGSVLTSLGIATGNTLEAWLGAFLINRLANGPACFERAKDIFKFAALAALLATTVSATIGVSVLVLGDYAARADFGAIWLTWWLGDAAGALIVTPLLVLFARRPRPLWHRPRVESALTLLLVLAIGLMLFTLPLLRTYPLAFLCLPPLVWVAFRFDQRAVAICVAILTVIATYATASGVGPFVLRSANESLLVLQAFMAALAMTALPIAALVAEHKATVHEREALRATAEENRAREQRARLQAEAANRAKDEFLAMLGHELRNPLQAIANSVYLLRKQPQSAAATRALDIVQRQTEHLTRMVNDLLDATRAITGKIGLERQPVDVAAVLRASVEAIETSGRFDPHRVDTALASVWIDGDAARLDQIFTNLLTNAYKYTPAGGTIRVSSEHADGEAVVRIADNGTGIAADLLPHVFDLFIQGERQLDRRDGGLGVGLTLVRRLVELHGGRVEARSAGPGQGAEFIVRLPACAPATAARSAPAPQITATPHRVLIVEDNDDARHTLRNLLEGAGHAVCETADGLAALEAAQRFAPDTAVIDIGLPRLDGYEVARRLRKRDLRMRLIALTGYGRAEDRQRAQEAGFDAHLVKPVTLDELQRALG
ncbi:MAG TPA: MASE1 domain-containing protein [Burkholderiaceae bacterium]|nr:MASE1 domain-containing protein [Burkholderiaceae bacterium]